MSRPSKYSGIVVNLLIAVAISLVVNFSYVLLLVVEKSDDRHPPFSRELRTDREIVRIEGDVWISPDGHGYLLYVSPERLSDGDAAATGLAEVAPARDSVYIPRNSARFLRLRSGDHLLADALESHRSGGRLVLGQVLERNGEPFDYGVIFERPQEGVIFALQLFFSSCWLSCCFRFCGWATACGRCRDFSNAVCCVRGLPSGSISSPLSCVGGRTS